MGTLIEFPDVSFYQGKINWVVMASKTRNVIIRSSQGNWIDSEFKTNYANAKANGIKRGIYHFADDRYHPNEQVAVVKGLIQNDLPETRVWVDWENLSYHDGGNYKGIHNVVLIMKGIESAFPGKVVVGLYTGYYWFNDHTDPNTDAADFTYLKEHPLWIAAYTADGSSGNLLIPQPWTYPPELHQWGTPAIGPDYGVQSQEIDMNRVLKNHNIYDSTVPIPPDPPTGGPMLGKVIVSALNMRREPNSNNTTNPPIGQLKLGDIIEAPFEVNGWWSINKITRAGIGIAVPATPCYAYEGTNNGYIEVLPEPPPVPAGAPKSAIVEDADGQTWKATNFTEYGP